MNKYTICKSVVNTLNISKYVKKLSILNYPNYNN